MSLLPGRSPVPGVLGRLRRVPPAVWWLCALNLVLLVAWSLLAPAWRGPDEPNHVDAVLALREDGTYPPYDARELDPGIRGSLELGHFERRASYLTVEESTPRPDRPGLEDLEDRGRSVSLQILNRPGTRNHITQHPPGYYALLAGVSGAADALLPGDGLGSHDRELAALRLVSLALMTPLPLVAWWVAREAGSGPTVALTAAVLPLAIPQLAHISALVNSDGPLALLLAVLTGLAVRLARGHVDHRTVALTGLVTGLALFTKGLALVAPPLAVAALLAGLWRHRAGASSPPAGPHPGSGPPGAPIPLSPAAVSLGLLGAVAFVSGGWWWLANLVNHGDISPSIEYETRLSDPPPGFSPSLGEWAGNWVPKFTGRFWGDFGWIDDHVPGPVVALATAVALAGLVMGLRGLPRSAPGPGARHSEPGHDGARRLWGGRPDALTLAVLVAPFLLLHFFVAANSLRLYRNAGFSPMVQGRYVFGGVVGIAVVVALGWHRLIGRWTPMAALAAAAGMQAVGMGVALTYYWGPVHASLAGRFRALAAWSPLPVRATAGVGVALAVVGVAAAVALWRARSGATPPRSAGPGRGRPPTTPVRAPSEAASGPPHTVAAGPQGPEGPGGHHL